VRSLLKETHARFKRARLAFGHGTANAWDEAVYLVLHALRLPLGDLTPVLERPLTAAEHRRVLKLIDARIERRIPAAYLTREAWLGDLRFYVDERVIVPRSFIAELLRERLRPWLPPRARIMRALDLGTGSGCLAIAIATAFPQARIVATDIARGALTVARRNVAAYGLQRRITLKRVDMFAGLEAERFDLIVSNPPYVGSASMRTLPPEYRHEPQLALASGVDGFDAVRTILRDAGRHLTRNGLLVVEVGHNRKSLEAAFPHLPFVWPHTQGGDCVFMLGRDDLARHEVQVARPPAAAGQHRARPSGAAFRRR
jgi:ribosomal protein L3 glutamine methyltransferase